MPLKQAAKGHEEAPNAENREALHESKRLQEIAYKGMLTETRRMCSEETTPSKVLLKADGKDITKKSSLRKGRYLLNINAQMAAAAEGRMGALSHLDTRNPVLYLDFPEGRLKFLGTLVFPANKYMVLKFGNRDILCEDVLDSMVVFSEAYWIGTKAENPEEHRMPMPMSIIEAGKKAQEAADTHEVTGTQVTANGAHDQPVRVPGSQRKRGAPADQDNSSSWDDEMDEEGVGPAMARRMSQRSAAKRVKYNVDLSDEDISRSDGDASNDDDSGEGFQELKRQACVPAASRKSRLQASQGEVASQQEAEAVGSAAGTAAAGRRQSVTAAGIGHLEPVREETEEEEVPDEPEMTQKSTQKGSQKAQKQENMGARQYRQTPALKVVASPGRQKATQPAKRRKLAKMVPDDHAEEEEEEVGDDVIDLSSPGPASLSQRPRRSASAKRPIVDDASTEDESEEAIEEDECDEDFIV